MESFQILQGIAAPMPLVNIDTDMIIPKQYLKTIKRSGLGVAAFSELRYAEDGSEKGDFILNQAPYREAQILVVGDNFGCGSSREHAPWALLDFGIRCVISTSFADIFFNNCFKNGILPIVLPETHRDLMLADAQGSRTPELTVDLAAQTITRPSGEKIPFEVDPFRKDCLLRGLDDIGLTLQQATEIDTYEATLAAQRPWV